MDTRALLLSGEPGVGKTTALRSVARSLQRAGVPIAGFFTQEMRDRGERVGFRIQGFDGEGTVLARVGLSSKHRVGRYGVDLAALARVVERTLERARRDAVVLVDEIGKMETLSPRFERAVRSVLVSGRPLVATIASAGGGLIGEIKRRPDVEVWELTWMNRDGVPSRALWWLEQRGVPLRPEPRAGL